MDALRTIQEHLDNGASGRDLGRRIGKSSGYISGLLLRQFRPTFEVASALADAVLGPEHAQRQAFLLNLLSLQLLRSRRKSPSKVLATG